MQWNVKGDARGSMGNSMPISHTTCISGFATAVRWGVKEERRDREIEIHTKDSRLDTGGRRETPK